MYRINVATLVQNLQVRNYGIIIFFVLANLLFNIVANASFKVSADSTNTRGFLTWQVIGNIAGFITVLTLTGLLRHMPLSMAFPLTTGLMVIGVQVVASRLLFNEPISLERWIGTLLVTAGIIFLTSR